MSESQTGGGEKNAWTILVAILILWRLGFQPPTWPAVRFTCRW